MRNFPVFFFLLLALLLNLASYPALGQTALKQRKDSSMRLIRQGFLVGRTDTGFVNDLLKASWQFHYLNRSDSAIVLAWKALGISRKIGFVLGEAHSLHAIGVNHRFADRYDSSLRYFQAAREKFLLIHFDEMVIATLGIEANTYISMAQYSKAVDYTFQAITLADSLIRHQQLPNSSASLYNFDENLGIVFTQLGMYDLALEYFSTSLMHSKKLNKLRQEERATLYYIGNLYSEMHEYAKAREYYERVITTPNIAETHSHIYTVCLRDYAKILLASGEHHQADSLLHFALGKLRVFQDKRGVARALVILSSLHLGQHHTKRALQEAEEAIRLAASIHALRELRDAYKAAAMAWASIGNTSTGFEMQKRYIALNDSIFSAQTTQRIAALNRNREFRRSEQQILLVQQQQEVEQLKARTIEIILAALVLFFGMVIVIVILQYRSKRSSEAALRIINAEILAQKVQLKQQNEDLLLLNEEKNEFLNITSHDLRTPLANIVGLSSMLDEEPLSTPQQQTLHTIRNIARRMMTLVEHLLEATTIERGEFAMRLEPCNLTSVVTQVLEQYRADIHLKSLIIQQCVDAELSVLADVNFVEQVISNIISNAMKYSPNGGKIWIHTAKELTQGTILLSVCNEGAGLTERDMTRVFHKFARLSARPTRGETSTGLGLYITKKLMDAMQGSVWCTSVAGKEATFVLAFRQYIAQQKCQANHTIHPRGRGKHGDEADNDCVPLPEIA